jgi:hypothetical protein
MNDGPFRVGKTQVSLITLIMALLLLGTRGGRGKPVKITLINHVPWYINGADP